MDSPINAKEDMNKDEDLLIKEKRLIDLIHETIEIIMKQLINIAEDHLEDPTKKVNFFLDTCINLSGNLCIQTLKDRKITTIEKSRNEMLSKMNDWFNLVISDVKFKNTLN